MPQASVEAHLLTCADCRAWSAAVTPGVPLGTAHPPAGFTEQVMRTVSADLSAAGNLRRQGLFLRGGLVAVSAVQLVLAVPVLVLGHDHAAPMHVAHELGSFDAAVALGLLAAARRPRLAAGMLPLVAAITALLMITAGSDLVAGRTDVLDEAAHLLDVVGFLLLRRLSVVELSDPGAPPALLVPITAGPRPSLGDGLRTRAVGLRRMVVVTVLAGLTLGGVAGPASAHVVHDGDDPTNWRSTITSVAPMVQGLTVATAEAGQRIGVTNATGSAVVVLGFYGEPFLQLAGGVVSANTRSATAHLVVSGLAGSPSKDPALAPSWHPIAQASTWWWHDPRTHFSAEQLPPEVAAHPGRFDHYQDWQLTLVAGGRTVQVTGALDWVPSHPETGAWLLGGLLLVLCTGIGWLRRWSRPLVVALVALTAADVVHAVAAASARVGSVGNHLAALPGHGALIAAVWVVAVLACIAAWRRRTTAVYLGLAAAGVTVMVDALPSAAVLWRSQAVTTLGHDQAALLVAAVIGTGAGTSIACLALMLRLDPAPSREWQAHRTPAATTLPESTTADTAGLPSAEGFGSASLTNG